MHDLPELGGLYTIHNHVNGKHYIGSTCNFRKRWNLHRCLLRNGRHHSAYLQNAWDKHGEVVFTFNVLQICDRPTRLMLEQHFFDTLPAQYNMSRKATSSEGCKRSPETSERMRAAILANPVRMIHIRELGKQPKSPEHRQRISEAHEGLVPTEQTRAKLRAASAIRWSKPEEHAKASLAKLGKRLPRKS